MKTSTLLKRAENYLWDGVGRRPDNKTAMLCYAIDAAVLRRTRQGAEVNVLHEINSRLQTGFYTTWAVRNNHLPVNWQNDSKYWYPIIQWNRLNWLRELQSEYRAKGD